MNGQPYRIQEGGRIDRTQTLSFRFDGKLYRGHPGDTLASALLANGVHLVGRSFKYHRPRGIFTAGSDEPNALVQLRTGSRTEPNTRATQVELYDGLIATSQNRWPSLAFDVGSVNGAFHKFIPAGFYYKTFMWPSSPRWWLLYEHAIRHAAGLGRSPTVADPDRYEHRFAQCDVLVVGAGAAGLAAARAASEGGARVLLCDESPTVGGCLHDYAGIIDGVAAAAWIDDGVAELAARQQVRVLTRTTAFGYYDDNLVGLLERVGDHLPNGSQARPRHRLWKVRASRVLLATGALERPIAYANNDLPGTMLAGAALTYVQRFGVRPGNRAVVFTNNDSAYTTAIALRAAGIEVVAIVDPRSVPEGSMRARARSAGIEIVARAALVAAHGRRHVRAVDVAPVSADGSVGRSPVRIECDLVCVSGGWNPAVHLFSQSRGRLRFEPAIAAFVPDVSPQPVLAIGAASGRFDLCHVLEDGHRAGLEAAAQTGKPADSASRPPTAPIAEDSQPILPLWAVPAGRASGKCFVDLQNDVTVSDIALAAREGYQSVEHLKRYTTLGMGTDQGKTSNTLGLALMAGQLGIPIPAVGTTTFRPPYTPVSLGALAGEDVGKDFAPTRYSPIHSWSVDHNAALINAGLWKRAQMYPRTGEADMDAAYREAVNVRKRVGLVDVSTLGKIELQGRDVAEFLNRVYVNRWDTLQVGRSKYGIMLREDGIVFDDGTTSRLADSHYLMTTTTANAAKVMQHLEYLLQVAWPQLNVFMTSTTEHWAAMAIAGPAARAVLAEIVNIDISNEAFPFLAAGECELRINKGRTVVNARLFRISYSGEMSYEVHVPARHGKAAWESMIGTGSDMGIQPYGTEAMGILRMEKGHIVIGAEIDGRTTAEDLGLSKLVSATKHCVGKSMLSRPEFSSPGRWQLVGLTAAGASGAVAIPSGSKLTPTDVGRAPPPMLGHVTSTCYSPNLDRSIGLALLAGGRARHGETLMATSPLLGRSVPVLVGTPCFIDPDGERLRA